MLRIFGIFSAKIILPTLLLLILTTINIKAQIATPPTGSGTSGDPYLVETLNNLYWITQNTSEWNKYYEQTANIDASSTSGWDGGAGFTPIGNSSSQFMGTYDGKGYLIDALHINRNATNFIGLFGFTNNASIENLGLTNVGNIGFFGVGGLVGQNYQTNITNCYTTGNVTGTSGYAGGLVGYNSNSVISNCYTTGDVSGINDYVGGLVGMNNNSNVSNCYSTGAVSGNNFVGGLVGSNHTNSSIVNCYATGNVSGTNGFAGGLVGVNYNNSNIINCYATGAVNGSTYSGGLVGQNDNSVINNSYATGTVTGVFNVGGFIGGNDGGSTNNCFWDVETSGQALSDGGTGKTTAEMKNIATFTDESTVGLTTAWDFVNNPNDDSNNDDFWNIKSIHNDGYPVLSWQLFITTFPVSEISLATATGNASAFGPSTTRGFCWNTTGSPTTEDDKTIESGSWTGEYTFSTAITGLSGDQIYYIRAYGSNSNGTFYGNEVSFFTIPTLGEWGLIALGSLTALLGGWFVWRRIV